ncbi:MAG: hypothetical protein CFE31_05495 [Rhizobiales bacterium PAR1]|nr:MAG: hypothetical protein CFE31_05495 [Rhizobiales bacterium PAR1]
MRIRFDGWNLYVTVSVLVAAGAFVAPVAMHFSVESLSAAVRFTARTSAILFILAFTASALARLYPSGPTLWQRVNRRFLGLAFATSHFIHAGFVIAYSLQGPEQYAEALTPDMIVVGSIGYALIILMAATSFQTTARWLGTKSWRLLHTVGVHWLWLQFLVAFGKRASTGQAIYWLFIGLLLAAMGARLVAGRLKPVASP